MFMFVSIHFIDKDEFNHICWYVTCSVTDVNIFSAEMSAGSRLLTQTEAGLNGRSWFIM